MQDDFTNQHGHSEIEPIWRARFAAADRMAVQGQAARAAEADPTPFYARFAALPPSLGGRFISADTFKETFDAYRGNPAHRQRYNAPLHNTCAALANAWLRHVLRQSRTPGRDAVVLITGVPGAGKTTAVLAAAGASNGLLPPGVHAVYEGQFVKPQTALAKVQDVLDAGWQPIIVVLHATPERALDNTLRRFAAIGRGASIHNMARLQGDLPDGLAVVRAAFGDAVALRIIDRRDFDQPQPLAGWAHLPVLSSEGNREHILQRLEKHLATLRGQLPAAAWRQASGLPPA
jgi:hypothetical protein